LASVLLGSAAAIPLGLWNALAVSVLFNNSFAVLAVGVTVAVVAAMSARDVRRRSRIFRAGLFVGFAAMACALSLAAIEGQAIGIVALQALSGLAGGIACAFLAALLIPLFEILFGITTNLTLIELSDMSHPLLQRLAMEAPGTYHHSIVTANLGLAAAAAIGANSLLVRVCAYFHDIGKLAKPEFFSENTSLQDNPHDDLSPNMSSLIITSHVKEGAALARRHRLPQCILDGIEQHHGTGLVQYFYHRARQEAEMAEAKPGPRPIDETDFRYDGPRPRSREIAILLLADAVEAAARSIEKPSPSRIDSLVREIVDGKLRDRQLDESDVTLAELTAIRESFLFTLANMLHVRIAYPQQDENRDLQLPGKPGGTRAERLAADTVAADSGGGAPLPPVVE
jgi:cyclic-di-AMP phosphodiesterase PgpH